MSKINVSLFCFSVSRVRDVSLPLCRVPPAQKKHVHHLQLRKQQWPAQQRRRRTHQHDPPTSKGQRVEEAQHRRKNSFSLCQQELGRRRTHFAKGVHLRMSDSISDTFRKSQTISDSFSQSQILSGNIRPSQTVSELLSSSQIVSDPLTHSHIISDYFRPSQIVLDALRYSQTISDSLRPC